MTFVVLTPTVNAPANPVNTTPPEWILYGGNGTNNSTTEFLIYENGWNDHVPIGEYDKLMSSGLSFGEVL